MQFPTPIALQWIAQLIDAKIIGDTNAKALGINEIHRVQPGDLAFVDHPKYYDKCLQSAASFIIINTENVNIPFGKTILVCSEPFEAYQKIVAHFKPLIAAQQLISATASIGKNTYIAPNVFIGENVMIGNNCIIHPNVTIHSDTVIGDHVIIQSGTVIGGDAFYYNTKKNRNAWYKKMLSGGNVTIEDEVEIGCNCTIDKGVSHTTLIGRGTKIDNLVHIGHDVIIGKNCLIAAQVGIAGATVLEDGVILWGQVGVNKTITIHENAIVMGQAGVTNSLEANKVYWGTPAIDFNEKRKELVWIKRIATMWAKVFPK